ncbi:YveK family protein [Planotetraspora sp. GP83]|uniref:YveK family protein n=1 Tax=Planotetraspora sp. GP83 TaxID=3156264 RepID=UPI003517771A
MGLPPHSRDLAEYGSVLRRRRLLFAFCLLAGVSGGGVLFVRTPPQYTSVAQVQVLPTGAQEQINQVTPRQREPLNLDTESQIAQSMVVASIAGQILKNTDPAGLRDRVTVDVPPNSAILSISFTAPDPLSAAAGAQAFADAYLRNRSRAATDTINAGLKVLAAKLRQVNADLDKTVSTGPVQPRGAAARTMAAHQQAVLARQASSLTLKYDALKTIAITPGTVISPAQPPPKPSAPSVPVYLGSGLFLGLLAGAGTAFGRDRLDTRLRTAADVERLTGLPLLAELPSRPDPSIFPELAATVATSLGDDEYHTLLLEGICAESHARPMAKGLGSALTPLAPVSVVTRRGARPDAAVLLVGLRRATSTQVARAVRQLTRQGTRVLGVVTVPPRLSVPEPDPAEQTT